MDGFLTSQVNCKVLDHLFGGARSEPVPELFVGLSLVDANKEGVVVEPAGDYRRAGVLNDSSHFPAASRGEKCNGRAITFAEPTHDWGRIRSVFVADAPRDGNVIAAANLATAKWIFAGSPAPTIQPGALFFTHS
ncbi:MAG: hypothetical protein KGM43_13050 [Planctomycetota bacterium]|nr:hypothetical protein [Planctomycetota bacterium]